MGKKIAIIYYERTDRALQIRNVWIDIRKVFESFEKMNASQYC